MEQRTIWTRFGIDRITGFTYFDLRPRTLVIALRHDAGGYYQGVCVACSMTQPPAQQILVDCTYRNLTPTSKPNKDAGDKGGLVDGRHHGPGSLSAEWLFSAASLRRGRQEVGFGAEVDGLISLVDIIITELEILCNERLNI